MTAPALVSGKEPGVWVLAGLRGAVQNMELDSIFISQLGRPQEPVFCAAGRADCPRPFSSTRSAFPLLPSSDFQKTKLYPWNLLGALLSPPHPGAICWGMHGRDPCQPPMSNPPPLADPIQRVGAVEGSSSVLSHQESPAVALP